MIKLVVLPDIMSGTTKTNLQKVIKTGRQLTTLVLSSTRYRCLSARTISASGSATLVACAQANIPYDQALLCCVAKNLHDKIKSSGVYTPLEKQLAQELLYPLMSRKVPTLIDPDTSNVSFLASLSRASSIRSLPDSVVKEAIVGPQPSAATTEKTVLEHVFVPPEPRVLAKRKARANTFSSQSVASGPNRKERRNMARDSDFSESEQAPLDLVAVNFINTNAARATVPILASCLNLGTTSALGYHTIEPITKQSRNRKLDLPHNPGEKCKACHFIHAHCMQGHDLDVPQFHRAVKAFHHRVTAKVGLKPVRTFCPDNDLGSDDEYAE